MLVSTNGNVSKSMPRLLHETREVLTLACIQPYLRRLETFYQRYVAEDVFGGVCKPLQKVVFQLHQLYFVLRGNVVGMA